MICYEEMYDRDLDLSCRNSMHRRKQPTYTGRDIRKLRRCPGYLAVAYVQAAYARTIHVRRRIYKHCGKKNRDAEDDENYDYNRFHTKHMFRPFIQGSPMIIMIILVPTRNVNVKL